MYRFLHPLFGEYSIRLRGEQILPFLRLLSDNRVLFWDFRGGDGEWELKTALASAEPLMENARQAGIEAEILAKRGLPFVIARYKKRPGLLLGLLLGLVLIFYAELFVWKVSVNGNTLLSDREIVQALERYGIGVGSYIPEIDVLRAQHEFIIEYPEISSAAINVKGTHIEVEVLERDRAPDIVQTDGYCNIAASEDGIILSVDVAAGSALVKPGDVVVAGQLLISAYTANERNVYLLHHARGRVMAQVYHSFSVVVPLKQETKRYTGRQTNKTTVTVLGKPFDLFLQEQSPYQQFDVLVEERPFYLLSVAETPIVRTTATYREYVLDSVVLSKEQAEQNAMDAFSAWLERQTDTMVDYEYQLQYDEIQNACVLNASVIFEKDIGTDVPVAVHEPPPEQVVPPTLP